MTTKTMTRWLVILLLLVAAVVWNYHAGAAMVAAAEQHGVRITLYDEPCALTACVSMDYRATWDEGGKRFEGCYAIYRIGVVGIYFDDKSFAIIPINAFQRARWI